jgi:hypothetical protein
MAQQALRKVAPDHAQARIAVERSRPAAPRPVLVARPGAVQPRGPGADVPSLSAHDELSAHVAELEAALDRARARLAELARSRPER